MHEQLPNGQVSPLTDIYLRAHTLHAAFGSPVRHAQLLVHVLRHVDIVACTAGLSRTGSEGLTILHPMSGSLGKSASAQGKLSVDAYPLCMPTQIL